MSTNLDHIPTYDEIPVYMNDCVELHPGDADWASFTQSFTAFVTLLFNEMQTQPGNTQSPLGNDIIKTSPYPLDVILPQGARIISYKIEVISTYYYETLVYFLNQMYYYVQYNTGLKISNGHLDNPTSRRLLGTSVEITGDTAQTQLTDFLSKISLKRGFRSSSMYLINTCYNDSLSDSLISPVPSDFFLKYSSNTY